MISNRNEGLSLLQWFTPGRKTIKRFGFILLFLLLFAYLILHIWIQLWFSNYVRGRESFDPKFYERVKTFLNTKLEFPEEWFEDRQPSSEAITNLLAEYGKIDRALKEAPNYSSLLDQVKQLDTAFYQGKILKKDKIDEYRGCIHSFDPSIRIAKQIGDQIKNEIVHPSGGQSNLGLPWNFWYDGGILVPLSANATFQFYDRNYEGAVDSILSQLIMIPPFEHILVFSTHFDSIGYSIQEMKALLGAISNPLYLQPWLETLNQLEPYLFREIDERMMIVSVMNKLRAIEKQGVKVDLKPGRKGSYYIRQIADWSLPKKDWSTSISRIGQNFLAGHQEKSESGRALLMQGLFGPILLTDKLEEYRLLSAYPFEKVDEIQSSQLVKANSYDRLRLEIAAKLYERETGKKVNATTDLVPRYFSKEIIDRVNGLPYRWDEKGEICDH